MTKEEFIPQLELLDSAFAPVQDPIRRLTAVFVACKGFELEVLKSAIEQLLRYHEDRYPPSSSKIFSACLDAQASVEKSRSLATVQRKVFKEPPHQCSKEKPENNPALTRLQWVSPYEAKHIFCDPKAKATCPDCGRRHEVPHPNSIDLICQEFPEQTKTWTRNWKGFCLCAECAEQERKTA